MSGSGPTAYRGVRRRTWGKFVSEIREPHRRPGARSNRIWLGSFRSAEEAAHAYDAALLCCRGVHGNLNFPNYPYTIPPGTVGHYSVREIQAAAAAAAAQYAGRPFSYGTFVGPQGGSDDDDNMDDISHNEGAGDYDVGGPSNVFNPDDPLNLGVNDNVANRYNSDDDDDDDDDDDSNDDDDPRLWSP